MGGDGAAQPGGGESPVDSAPTGAAESIGSEGRWMRRGWEVEEQHAGELPPAAVGGGVGRWRGSRKLRCRATRGRTSLRRKKERG